MLCIYSTARLDWHSISDKTARIPFDRRPRVHKLHATNPQVGACRLVLEMVRKALEYPGIARECAVFSSSFGHQ